MSKIEAADIVLKVLALSTLSTSSFETWLSPNLSPLVQEGLSHCKITRLFNTTIFWGEKYVILHCKQSDSVLPLCGAGLSYLWEQERFDPVRRQLTCHISLKDPHTNQVHCELMSVLGLMHLHSSLPDSNTLSQVMHIQSTDGSGLHVVF